MLRRNALGILALAAAFCLFFQSSKHSPALSRVNPFAEDPYDAIGSFGVQFVLFLTMVSLIRAFRPHPPDAPRKAQERVLARGQLMGFLAVAVMLVADAIAMVRHPATWLGSFAGYELLTLAGALLLWATLAGWLLIRSARSLSLASRQYTWTKAAAIPIATILALALYPEGLRRNPFGELFTVLAGAALLFVPVWALGTVVIPSSAETECDFIDDITAVYRALKARAGLLRPACVFLERVLQWPSMRMVFGRFSPRKHRWSFTVLIGILLGAFLACEELAGGDGPHRLRKLFVVATVYIGLESAGVVMGYALLAKPLGLIRQSDHER